MSDRDVDIQIAPGRVVEVDDFVDITGQVAEEIRPESDGWFRVRFPNDVTEAEAEAVRRRTRAGSSVEEQLFDRARAAFAANVDFLSRPSTTAAQDKAQVKALTRQTNALIRLVTRTLDSTDGT